MSLWNRKRHSNRWCEDDLEYEPSLTSNTLIEEEKPDVINTGLVDQYGKPIRRMREKIKMGYIK